MTPTSQNLHTEATMTRFALGIIVGCLLTTSLGFAGKFYDSSGKPNAPNGSIQSYDYFRMRQQFIDVGHIAQQGTKPIPCAK
jgi:hypothetical protein